MVKNSVYIDAGTIYQTLLDLRLLEICVIASSAYEGGGGKYLYSLQYVN